MRCGMLAELVITVEAYVASWIEIVGLESPLIQLLVEAYVASWIEILGYRGCRKLHGVEAYVASWIEIICGVIIVNRIGSRLT